MIWLSKCNIRFTLTTLAVEEFQKQLYCSDHWFSCFLFFSSIRVQILRSSAISKRMGGLSNFLLILVSIMLKEGCTSLKSNLYLSTSVSNIFSYLSFHFSSIFWSIFFFCFYSSSLSVFDHSISLTFWLISSVSCVW